VARGRKSCLKRLFLEAVSVFFFFFFEERLRRVILEVSHVSLKK
jgi:hypothetical protein